MDHSIEFSGEILEGFTLDEVKANFARLFKITDSQRVDLYFSGTPITLKTGLDATIAQQYQLTLARVGARCNIQQAAVAAAVPEPQEAAATPQAGSVWWIIRNQEKIGPYARDELTAMAAQGQILLTDQIWKTGLTSPLAPASQAWLKLPAARSIKAKHFDLPATLTLPHRCKLDGQVRLRNLLMATACIAAPTVLAIAAVTEVWPKESAIFLLSIALLLAGQFLYGLRLFISTIRYQIILSANAISIRQLWRPKVLPRQSLAGRRWEQAYVERVSLETANARTVATIEQAHLNRDPQLALWINSLHDLDAGEDAIAEKKLLNDAKLGGTPQRRQLALKGARKIATVLNAASTGLMVWALLYPRPYSLLILAGLALPVISLLLIRHRPGLYRLSLLRQKSTLPNLVATCSGPAIALTFRIYQDSNLLHPEQTTWPILLIATLFTALVFRIDRTLTLRPANLIPIGLICALYANIVLREANQWLDHAPAKAYAATVENRDRVTTTPLVDIQKLQLSADHGPMLGSLTVPVAFFDHAGIGDTVCAYVHPGRLNMPWVQVAPCGATQAPHSLWEAGAQIDAPITVPNADFDPNADIIDVDIPCIDSIIDQQRRKFLHRVVNGATIDDISASGAQVRIKATLLNWTAAELPPDYSTREGHQELASQVCAAPDLPAMLHGGLTLTYAYRGSDHKPVGDINISYKDCKRGSAVQVH